MSVVESHRYEEHGCGRGPTDSQDLQIRVSLFSKTSLVKEGRLVTTRSCDSGRHRTVKRVLVESDPCDLYIIFNMEKYLLKDPFKIRDKSTQQGGIAIYNFRD